MEAKQKIEKEMAQVRKLNKMINDSVMKTLHEYEKVRHLNKMINNHVKIYMLRKNAHNTTFKLFENKLRKKSASNKK